ncbi:hypothetical protein F444_08122 [Phytophthora nicotianae P1976]|uniref:Uncharacterized protein n=1 Tax=Phytophthora nicotianae P1976 TaxID=1317066 RepID=A0A081AC91_PHYNI|nr:hypothetical protein F444_08122 [Phytophthora nicotianae P1976]
MVKARSSRVMAPQAAAPLAIAYAGTSRIGKAYLKYVRLRREEQSSMVVLSNGEIYARAQSLFEPVIEKLSGLSTVEFYVQMSKWKSVVDREQENTTAANSSTDGNSTAIKPTESDSGSFFDQLGYADMMAEMEADQVLAMKADSMTDLVREHSLGAQDDGNSETAESPSFSESDECPSTQVSN